MHRLCTRLKEREKEERGALGNSAAKLWDIRNSDLLPLRCRTSRFTFFRRKVRFPTEVSSTVNEALNIASGSGGPRTEERGKQQVRGSG
ncbi:hypothetical protein K1719_043712 [Acacia pycnantha]|nr:hypothetical protein K1719_043712 [Acacia pycnantha]